MHKLTLVPFVIGVLLFLGCGDAETARKRQATGGLPAADYQRILKINNMLQDAIDARDAVYSSVAPMISEKATKLSAKIGAPYCVKKNDVPDDDLSGAINDETIYSNDDRCPIYWYRRRGWTTSNKIMIMTDNLEVRAPQDLKDILPMTARIMNGSYRLDVGTENRVHGVINITKLQTTEFGNMNGAITIDSVVDGDRGAGSVTLSLDGNRSTNTASVSWKIQRGAMTGLLYRIGNVKVDKDKFDELFSSWELDKYVHNAINMK